MTLERLLECRHLSQTICDSPKALSPQKPALSAQTVSPVSPRMGKLLYSKTVVLRLLILFLGFHSPDVRAAVLVGTAAVAAGAVAVAKSKTKKEDPPSARARSSNSVPNSPRDRREDRTRSRANSTSAVQSQPHTSADRNRAHSARSRDFSKVRLTLSLHPVTPVA